MGNPQSLTIDDAELAEAVYRGWGQRVESANEWTCISLGDAATVSGSRGLWRVSSTRTASGQPEWSLVLKVLHHSARGHKYWLSSGDVEDPMYWKREPMLYASGLLDSFAGGFRAPRYLGHHEQSTGEVYLWLEDVSGLPGTSWTLDHYRLAARQLGYAQGEFLTTRALPDWRWLSRRWLRAYVERRSSEMSVEPPSERWNERLVRLAFPDPVWESAVRIWRERHQILGLLEELPRTLCHEDFWPKNLFMQLVSPELPQTIAIDWAFAGIGAVGEDAGNLVPDSMLDLFIDGRKYASSLTEAIYAEYCSGLRAAGAKVPPEVVRFALTATAGLKYVWMIPRMVVTADEQAAAQQFRVSVEELYAQRGAVMRHMLTLADEARGLIPDVTRFVEASS